MQPVLLEMQSWQREIRPVLAEMVAQQRDSVLALTAIQPMLSEFHRLTSNRAADPLAQDTGRADA